MNTDLINKTGDFIHKAWCVEGDTKFEKLVEIPYSHSSLTGMLFKIEDARRGEFYVGIYKDIATQSNSEEGEQPMKEPLVFPFSFVEWYSGMSAEKIERAWKRYQIDHGYTLTKK